MMFRPEIAAPIAEKTASDGTVVRVLELPSLQGSDDPRLAQDLFFAQQAGMKVKIVEIELKNGTCTLEPGALYFMKGDLELKTNTGGAGLIGGVFRKVVGGETMFVNQISGTGSVYLEPTFGHVLLHEIKTDEQAVIADKGAFYAGTSGIKVTASMVRSLSGAALGNEGLFQTKIEGLGVAVLFSPVPQGELIKVKLDGDTLQVDGNFALMRSAGISFGVEKSSKNWIGTAVSGEGLLNVYRGRGTVWLAPTQGIYERMARMGLDLATATGKGQSTTTNTRGG